MFSENDRVRPSGARSWRRKRRRESATVARFWSRCVGHTNAACDANAALFEQLLHRQSGRLSGRNHRQFQIGRSVSGRNCPAKRKKVWPRLARDSEIGITARLPGGDLVCKAFKRGRRLHDQRRRISRLGARHDLNRNRIIVESNRANWCAKLEEYVANAPAL